MDTRLDILIYAHDGRGLGHASRSIGIGMALRRLYPALKVLFISGSPFTAELIDCVPLDWLKLPAYATKIVNGRSLGVAGASNFSDSDLAKLRSRTIAQVVELYRPRIVLCDHSPVGKHKELVEAQSLGNETEWIVGIRGVVGGVAQVFSSAAVDGFQRYFSHILWYGDSKTLGRSSLDELESCFSSTAHECGYVARLAELRSYQDQTDPPDRDICCTVSIPWQSEETAAVLRNLSRALTSIGPQHGRWKLFVGRGDSDPARLFDHLPHVDVELPGRAYGQALLRSKTAMIYGGCNSLTDTLSLNIPATVLLRAMADEEQQLHLEALVRKTGDLLHALPEQEATAEALEQGLRSRLTSASTSHHVALDGAEKAAHFLARQLGL